MNERTGQQVGNYRIIRPLGQGGFADVYLGEHLYLKRHAALKVLRRSLQEKDVAQFLSEAQTLAHLMHPHIVQVFEYAIEQGMPVLIMDYAPGGTVRDGYPRGSHLPPRTVAIYIKQVAAALQYAHNQNVIHRDIKPENMLLRSPKELVLSDFGLALLTPSPEFLSTQAMAGTVPYIAPEQIRGKAVFASDQYSLAIVTYEWLCGRRPFEGDQYLILYQHVSTPPPALHEFAPDLPASIEEVVLKALAKDPQERFASVQSFAHALERACQHSDMADGHASFETLPEYPVSEAHPQQKAYLVSAPSDAPFLARLQADLEERGVCIEHGTSEQTLTNTLDEEEVRRQAMRTADIVLVLLSPSTRTSRTLKEYLQLASMYERRLLFVWVAGEEIAQVLPDSWGKAATIALIDAREDRYAPALDEIVAYIEEGPSITAHIQEEPVEMLAEPRNPYKGLRAFTADDTTDFFGRETLIDELVETTREMLTVKPPAAISVRLLTLTGPSGSGKSSVVLAGLLPRLQQGAVPGSAAWVYLEPLVPGTHPLEALALTLAIHLPDRSLTSIRQDLADDSARGLHLLARYLSPQREQRVVLVIDQFEELFTLTKSEAERRQFIDLLVAAVTEPAGPLLAVLTLRADFYDRPLTYPALGGILHQYRHVVLPMEPYELRAVIERPAALPDVQLLFEGTLVGDLLYETQGQVGALPLLEFTLDLLFECREGSRLTQQAYQRIGGVRGALAKHAEATYAALPSEEYRRLARVLFLRLIDPGQTPQDTTRRRAALSELLLPDAHDTARLREVADTFIAARLLTANEVGGVTTIEVSHEALIREWMRLACWLDEARDDIRLQHTLSEDVLAWEQHNKPRDRLYRGSQLREARAWARRNSPSRQEVAFLQASLGHRRRSVGSVIAPLLLLVLVSGIALRLFLVPNVPPPTLVTTLKEDGPGSLRQVIVAAKPGDTITFDPSLKGSIFLKEDVSLDIQKNLTIRGPGAGTLSINGSLSASENAGLDISKGVSVFISGLAFRSSGIGNEGTLTLMNCEVSQNKNDIDTIGNRGTLNLINSVISHNNNKPTEVGPIDNAGTMNIMNSTISDNAPGGIYNGGELVLMNSTVVGNTEGPGLFSDGGRLSVINSTIASNSGDIGGGIYSGSGTVMLSNSTIADNKASQMPVYGQLVGGDGDGGGIFIWGGVVKVTFCTIYGNTAEHEGGGVWNRVNFPFPGNNVFKASGHLEMTNTLVGGNHAPAQPDIAGELLSHGYNLIQHISDATFVAPLKEHLTDISGDQFADLGIDPHLQDNGGSTQPHTWTHKLLPGSPALGVIPLDACLIDGKPSTDQRGVRRPQGKGCDIGAYELST